MTPGRSEASFICLHSLCDNRKKIHLFSCLWYDYENTIIHLSSTGGYKSLAKFIGIYIYIDRIEAMQNDDQMAGFALEKISVENDDFKSKICCNLTIKRSSVFP